MERGAIKIMKLAKKLILSFFIASFLYPLADIWSRTEARNSKKPSAEICAKALQAVSWEARLETLEDRLKIFMSLLDRHPNIVTANLQFPRSLPETYSLVPELRAALGKNAASFETTPPRVHRLRYVASGEAHYDGEAVKDFLDKRVADVEHLNLLDGGNIAAQIRHLKKTSRSEDGRFNEKTFKKQLRRFLHVMPLLFDSSGQARFQRWQEDRENIIKKIRTLSPAEIESQYGDLLKEHLSHLIEEVSKERGLGQVQDIFVGLQNNFLEKEVRAALTPILNNRRSDGDIQERVLSLETLPAWVSIARGCYGGDCSILSVPYYSLVKGVKVHFIRKTHDLSEQPSGYAFSVPVKVKGIMVPYILTINGVTLTQADVEMAVRSIAEEYGSHEVVLPDFQKQPDLVNTQAARNGMTISKRQAVSVTLPPGWKTVDQFMKSHQVRGYRNYYFGRSIQRAFLSRLPERDPRILDSRVEQELSAPSYVELQNLLNVPLIQRAILGVQASSYTGAKMKDVLDALNLTQSQVEAARPLVELSSTRSLKWSEYQQLQEELGFGLENLLDLDGSVRAASLRSLYRERPQLFSEHGIRKSPKGVNALIEAYGPAFPEEIRRVLQTSEISDEKALQILEQFKPAMTAGDLKQALEFQKTFEGTALYSWANVALPQAFVRMNLAKTAIGRKLDAALSLKDRDERAFALAVLHESSQKTSLMFQAFQEIHKRMEEEGLSYKSAVESWLGSSEGNSRAKARYLGIFFNNSRFQKLLNKTPERQEGEVVEAIDDFSSYFLFERLARGDLPPNLTLESFEFKKIPISKDSPRTEASQIQTTPLTQGQFEMVMGYNPSFFNWGIESINHPVEQVTGDEAVAVAKKMSELDPNWDYRLPTKAELKLMTKAGTKTDYFFGNDPSKLLKYGWFHENSDDKTHPVALLRPNPWGLYDVYGSVSVITKDEEVDPLSPESGQYGIVSVGGSYLNELDYVVSHPSTTWDNIDSVISDRGIRLVRTRKAGR